VLRTAGEQASLTRRHAEPMRRARLAKQIENLEKDADRYDDEPSSNETQQLPPRQGCEHQRDEAWRAPTITISLGGSDRYTSACHITRHDVLGTVRGWSSRVSRSLSSAYGSPPRDFLTHASHEAPTPAFPIGHCAAA